MDAWQISVSAPAQVDGLIKRALGKRASKRKIALHIPHYVVVPMILARGDLIAVVPKSVATAYGYASELKALPLPFELPPAPYADGDEPWRMPRQGDEDFDERMGEWQAARRGEGGGASERPLAPLASSPTSS